MKRWINVLSFSLGLAVFSYWLSWACYCFIIVTIISALVIAIFSINVLNYFLYQVFRYVDVDHCSVGEVDLLLKLALFATKLLNEEGDSSEGVGYDYCGDNLCNGCKRHHFCTVRVDLVNSEQDDWVVDGHYPLMIERLFPEVGLMINDVLWAGPVFIDVCL